MEDIKEARLAQLELENIQSIIDLRNAQAQLTSTLAGHKNY
jgi:hypothetical protein